MKHQERIDRLYGEIYRAIGYEENVLYEGHYTAYEHHFLRNLLSEVEQLPSVCINCIKEADAKIVAEAAEHFKYVDNCRISRKMYPIREKLLEMVYAAREAEVFTVEDIRTFNKDVQIYCVKKDGVKYKVVRFHDVEVTLPNRLIAVYARTTVYGFHNYYIQITVDWKNLPYFQNEEYVRSGSIYDCPLYEQVTHNGRKGYRKLPEAPKFLWGKIIT